MNIFDGKFWTATRRLWLYQIITATAPFVLDDPVFGRLDEGVLIW